MQTKSPSPDELAQLFAEPPLEYSDFMTYFWESGKLSKEQLTWQLEQIKAKGVGGTWYYPRYVRGEPHAQPPYWSDGWWEFFEHYVAEHERLGMTVWFADWTGQESWQDKLRAESEHNPDLKGGRLVIHQAEGRDDETLQFEIPADEELLCARAFRVIQGASPQSPNETIKLDGDDSLDLADKIADGRLSWQVPDGAWMAAVVCSQPHDLDYLNPHVAQRWLDIYWEPHIEHLGRFVPDTLRGYLQDEIYVLGGNIVYAESLLARFQSENGYDPRPLLVGLFHDIGDFTDKIRCEYYDVMSALLEENLYRPLSDWHEARGMQFSTIATWGRQSMQGQTYQYGDIFRLCRWFHITGNEDPGHTEPGGRCFADAKLSSSVLHLYERDRAAMCVYWGSGHGMTQEENLAWTNENYAYGLNMYNTHGGLYGSLGSWYEWVPPSVHFRQPYWEHWDCFTQHVSRLSAVLSQGVHRADVALLYPLTSIHANWLKGDHFTAAGDEIEMEGMALAQQIYTSGIDFDFVDDLKLNEATVNDGILHIDELEFRVVLMPPMTTIRTDTLEKIKAFCEGGGTVIAVSHLPGGSAEHGRNDPRIRELLAELFGIPTSSDYIHAVGRSMQGLSSVSTQRHAGGGQAIFIPQPELHRNIWHDPGFFRIKADTATVISNAIERDVVASGGVTLGEAGDIYHTHQRIDALDVYFLYNVRAEKRSLTFTFRVEGDPEIWDTFSGRILPYHRFERHEGKTTVRLEMERNQGIVLVFRAGERPQIVHDDLDTVVDVQAGAEGPVIDGYCTTGGRKQVRIQYGTETCIGEARIESPPPPINLAGDWDFELRPTMDNRWGDWRWPASDAMVGPEARIFRYREEAAGAGCAAGWHQPDFNDAAWDEVTYSFGPYWLGLGPFADGAEPDDIASIIAGDADPEGVWEEHVFSQTLGHLSMDVYGAHAGVHGLDDHFIYFPATGDEEDSWRCLFTWVHVSEAGDWDFHFGHGDGQDQHEQLWAYDTGGHGGAGQRAWINGREVVTFGPDQQAAIVPVRLEQGLNRVMIKLLHHQGQSINIYAAFRPTDDAAAQETPPPPYLKWFAGDNLPTYDIAPNTTGRVGWYRFEAPAGTRTITLPLEAAAAQAWVNGNEVEIRDGCIDVPSPLDRVEGSPIADSVTQIALRLEQTPGCYAGAAIPEPVRFTCGPTRMPLGDWSGYALETYSGGAVYSKEFTLTAAHLDTAITLDLGEARISAEVEVNGRYVGVGLGRPYCFDITEYVREGVNALKVSVYNSLANHYAVAFPSSYVFEGQTVSGLLGPVELRFSTRVRLTANAR